MGYGGDQTNGEHAAPWCTPGARPQSLGSTLLAYRDSLNPEAIGRQIADLQVMLLKLSKDNTEQLYLASFPSALPDIRKGSRIKAS